MVKLGQRRRTGGKVPHVTSALLSQACELEGITTFTTGSHYCDDVNRLALAGSYLSLTPAWMRAVGPRFCLFGDDVSEVS